MQKLIRSVENQNIHQNSKKNKLKSTVPSAISCPKLFPNLYYLSVIDCSISNFSYPEKLRESQLQKIR